MMSREGAGRPDRNWLQIVFLMVKALTQDAFLQPRLVGDRGGGFTS